MLPLLLVLLVADRPIDLLPSEFEVGQVGYFRQGTATIFKVKVVQIIDDNLALMQLGDMPPFLATLKTAGLADGKFVEMPGVWRVVGTKKLGRKTYYHVTPHRPKK